MSGGAPLDCHLARWGVTVRPGGTLALQMDKVVTGQVSVIRRSVTNGGTENDPAGVASMLLPHAAHGSMNLVERGGVISRRFI